VERVPVGEALGRVSAAPVSARWSSPRAGCAAMDGIAVGAARLAAADGDGTVRLPPRTFTWIDTGDPMPDGADTVVMRERLLPQADGGVIVTPAASRAQAGRNVRLAGEDFRSGDPLLPAGRRLRAGDLAAAAAGGHLTLAVARRPVVAVIPTGDEIRPVGSMLRHGDIVDTNSLMLAARCHQLGAVPVVSDVVPDDPDALAGQLRQAAPVADLILVIAGSSRGRGDHAGAVIGQVGGVAVAGVALRPGHPAILGHVKAAADAAHRDRAADDRRVAPRAGVVPVIGLPGYPLAAAVVFELFAVPMLAATTGQSPSGECLRARLDRDWTSPADVEEWVLVTLCPGGSGRLPLATPARRGASSISLLARADAWWRVPHGQGTFPAGSEVELLPVR
jgi:putative molybdopterin biosynthesis protein